MKKYLFFCIPVLMILSQNIEAQLHVPKLPAQKQTEVLFAFPAIQSAEKMVTPVHIDSVHIDLLKPTVVFLDLTDQMKKTKVKCDLVKLLKPTLALEAERANNLTVNLEWETKYAFTASGFDIERSPADTFHFASVNFAQVSAKTNFTKKYNLPDYNDHSGISFYRIKQLNRDTTYRYSNIVSVKGYDVAPFRIYPNPAAGRLWIEFTTKQGGAASIMVYDLAGKTLQQHSIVCTENRLIVQSIDVSKLAAGLYQVRILMPDKTFLTKKFVKK